VVQIRLRQLGLEHPGREDEDATRPPGSAVDPGDQPIRRALGAHRDGTLNESAQFHPDAVERQLAHIETNGVRRAYTRGEYWNERVTMTQFWSNELDRMRSGAKVLKPNFGGRQALA
jgi:hypothetical protein